MSYSGYLWSSQTKKGTSAPPKIVIWSYSGFSGNSYPYDASMQEKLEAAYKSKQKKMSFDVKNEKYMIDFERMLQINQRDNSKVRKVTRDKVKKTKTPPQQPTNKQAALQKSKSTSSLVLTQKVEAKPADKSPSPSTTTTMTSAPIIPVISDKKTPQPEWQWQHNRGDWQKFEDNLQGLLESRYQDNIETYTFSRDGNLYDINFRNQTQMSRLPCPETRSIRRIDPEKNILHSRSATLLNSAKSKINSFIASFSSQSIKEAEPATTPGNTLDLPNDVPHVWYYIDDDGAKIEYTEKNQEKLESCRSSGCFFTFIIIGSDCLFVDIEGMKQTKYGDQTYSPKLVIREPKKLTDRDLHSTKSLV